MKKVMLRVLLVTALLCFSIGVFTACNTGHVHNFKPTYETNATEHWQICDCGQKTNHSVHNGGKATCSEQAVCEVCSASYGELVEHSHTIPVVTETTHYLQCDCGNTTTPIEHVYNNGACSCGHKQVATHTHEFSLLNINESSHWYECFCGVTNNGKNHFGGTADCTHKAICEGCSQEYGELGHKLNNGELTSTPTEVANGAITYTCTICNDTKEEIVTAGSNVITRADLEQAIVDTAWAYYMKGPQLQYDSLNLTKIVANYGGIARHSQEVSPEYGTTYTTIYSVCSAFTGASYYEALGHRIFEEKYRTNSASTAYVWYFSDNQPEQGYYPTLTNEKDVVTENEKDIAVLRWVNWTIYREERPTEATTAEKFGVYDSTAFYDWYEGGNLELRNENGEYVYYLDGEQKSYYEIKSLVMAELIENNYANVRPGDIIQHEGHALLYIGNGYVLDSTGDKYDLSTGGDYIEAAGSVGGHMKTLENTLDSCNQIYLICRPLDFYATDLDGNPGNDVIMYENKVVEPKSATLTREKYPTMSIDRTVDKTPFGTFASGENVTYKIIIKNNTTESKYRMWKGNGYNGQDYYDLVVTETIPQGTTFVSASSGITPINGVLTWELDIPKGELVELTYTVNVTAPIGSVIVNDGGFVENIPSNILKNRVGGPKLTQQQINVLSQIASSKVNNWATTYGKDTDFAENIYKAMGIDLTLPSLQELVQNLFTPTYLKEIPSFAVLSPTYTTPVTMFMPQKTVSEQYAQAKSMLIDGYYGGYRMYDMDLNKVLEYGIDGIDYFVEMNKSIIEFKLDYLEVGDILVLGTSKNRTDTGLTSQLENYSVIIYAGNDTLIEMNAKGEGRVYTGSRAKTFLVRTMRNTNDIFFALRPTQAGILG